MAWLSFFIADAHAQAADITIRTPAIQAIQDRMTQRYRSKLAPLFAAGALGFCNAGLVPARTSPAVPPRERAPLPGLVADENSARNAVIREIAVAKGPPPW